MTKLRNSSPTEAKDGEETMLSVAGLEQNVHKIVSDGAVHVDRHAVP